MCPVIRSETLHSEPTDFFMVSNAEGRLCCKVLTMRVEETENREEGMYIWHREYNNIGAQGTGHKSLTSLVARLSLFHINHCHKAICKEHLNLSPPELLHG